MGLAVSKPLVEKTTPVASMETIKKFVKELAEVAQTIKDARDDRNEIINENDEIKKLDEDIKTLKEERKETIANNPVIQGYEEKLQEAMEDKRQLIADAKDDGVPRKEIDAAIKMLKKDIDPELTTEVYSNIADLVD
jgi:DNA repair exonuclease SbcCD ATPase subunit